LIVPARCFFFHPEKAEEGEKVEEKNHRVSSTSNTSFVNPQGGKRQSACVLLGDLPQRFIYALAVDQAIYDLNDPGRNN